MFSIANRFFIAKKWWGMGQAAVQLTAKTIEELLASGHLSLDWRGGFEASFVPSVRRFSIDNNIGPSGVVDVFLEGDALHQIVDSARVPRIYAEFNKTPTIRHINYSSTELCEV